MGIWISSFFTLFHIAIELIYVEQYFLFLKIFAFRYAEFSGCVYEKGSTWSNITGTITMLIIFPCIEEQIEFEEEAGIVHEESLNLLETSLPTPIKTGTLSVVLRSYEVNLNVMCS
ncbi:UNVERIFIED_CONTAM: hypothetical protein NCL1_46710 [Trichonephila clavipes]